MSEPQTPVNDKPASGGSDCYAAALRLVPPGQEQREKLDVIRDGLEVAAALIAIRCEPKAWMRSAPFEVQEFMRSVHMTNFLHERRKEAFQMQGRYDGAMSAECKARFANEHKLLTELIEELSA